MGQYRSLAMSQPWLRIGEGGAMKEMFIALFSKILSGATENIGIKYFKFRAKNPKIFVS